MRSVPFVASLLFVGLIADGASAFLSPFRDRDARRLADLNRTLAGQVLDLTANHGCDRRLFSPALGERRDVYVYLPPGYDGITQFPAILWLHPLGFDERHFLEVVADLDAGIRAGTFPPVVIAAPDGSIGGTRSFRNGGSFYANSVAGRFEDYVMADVWGFVTTNFAVRPEREARMVAGASMGGFGAFSLGFRCKGAFGHLVGVMPPLDLRYADCHGRYLAPFDPACRGERTEFPRREVIGKFLHGVLKVRSKRLLDPLVGNNGLFHRDELDRSEAIREINPKDLLTSRDIRPGEFEMFIGYGTRDEFNIDAQVESFLEAARSRGLRPDVVVVPNGRHNHDTALAIFPHFSRWTQERLGPYAPAIDPASVRGAAVIPFCAVRPSIGCGRGSAPAQPSPRTLP